MTGIRSRQESVRLQPMHRDRPPIDISSRTRERRTVEKLPKVNPRSVKKMRKSVVIPHKDTRPSVFLRWKNAMVPARSNAMKASIVVVSPDCVR